MHASELVLAKHAHVCHPTELPLTVWVHVQPVLAGRRDLVIADHAGSGKTLAYLAPLAQKLMEQERALQPSPRPSTPRVVVMTPTAELCAQVSPA